MNKINKETAIKEINEWFEIIGYDESRIEEGENLPTDEMMLKSVMSGEATFTENHELKINLKEPIKDKDGEILHSELIFKNFVPMYEYNKAVRGIRTDDADARMLATISAFTNVAKSRIDRMSTKSYRILQVAAGYLL